MYYRASPSGKASSFGPDIRRFESFRPSKNKVLLLMLKIWGIYENYQN